MFDGMRIISRRRKNHTCIHVYVCMSVYVSVCMSVYACICVPKKEMFLLLIMHFPETKVSVQTKRTTSKFTSCYLKHYSFKICLGNYLLSLA